MGRCVSDMFHRGRDLTIQDTHPDHQNECSGCQLSRSSGANAGCTLPYYLTLNELVCDYQLEITVNLHFELICHSPISNSWPENE
jgi:hypothetical protein